MKTPWTVKFIVTLNILIFITWYLVPGTLYERFMVENFLVSWEALIEGRYWVLVTSAFSHNMLFHLLINMFVLRGFGEIITDLLGPKKFMLFYLLAGISGSLTHALVSNYLMDQPYSPALGASGAIAGLILLFSLIFPEKKLLLLGIIPIKAYWGAILFIGIDTYGLLEQTRGGSSPIGHGAHLGGALMGILFFLLNRKRF